MDGEYYYNSNLGGVGVKRFLDFRIYDPVLIASPILFLAY